MDTLGPISERTGAAIPTRGQYLFPNSHKARFQDQETCASSTCLFGPLLNSLSRELKQNSKHILDDITSQALASTPGGAQLEIHQVMQVRN
ncbi:hypothetical protein ACFX13_011437 [Malus domestica]|uniref:Uncharacterized protein n=1 Tax=Malus domestica TaxID=3750 RepID=A0A498IBC4_MALDO|nr:hypothetical protein DVH24_040581 [Malus domestica]